MNHKNELVRGTFLISLSILITKILGLIYIIPFYAIIGGEKNLVPFNYAYTPYNIAIAIATAGIPLAASKYVSKYNALGAYKISQKFYKSSFIIMITTGLIGFVILYLLAPNIATITVSNKDSIKSDWSIDEITWNIRIISIVVIFVPLLATWRGIFQGYKSMGPTAVSEVVEQVARVLFILIGSYLVLKVFNGSLLAANGIATFAAAIGAISGILVLCYYWRKRKNNIEKMIIKDKTNLDVSYRKMYKEIISYSIPFVIVSLNFPLFNLVDQFTHNNALSLAGVPSREHGYFFTILNMTTNKIVMIPTSLSAGFAISLIPFIIKTYTTGQLTKMYNQIRTSLGILMYITVPASLGIMALALPLYTVFYRYNIDGSRILFYYAPVAILIALLSVTSSILQGINKQKLTVVVITAAVLIKVLLNIPLIFMFHTTGAILSTAIALLFAVLCNLYILKKYIKFDFSETWIHFSQIILCSLIMMISVELTFFILQMFISPEHKTGALIILILSILVGITVYIFSTMRIRLADQFLGEVPNRIRNKLSFLD